MSRNFAYLNICHNNQHIDCEFVDIIGTRRQDNLSSRMQHLNWQVTAAARYSPVASELVLVTAPGQSRGSSGTSKLSVLAAQLRLTAAGCSCKTPSSHLHSSVKLRPGAKLHQCQIKLLLIHNFLLTIIQTKMLELLHDANLFRSADDRDVRITKLEDCACAKFSLRSSCFFVISYNITFMQPILSIYGNYDWW